MLNFDGSLPYNSDDDAWQELRSITSWGPSRAANRFMGNHHIGIYSGTPLIRTPTGPAQVSINGVSVLSGLSEKTLQTHVLSKKRP